jgi:hypothetical protein
MSDTVKTRVTCDLGEGTMKNLEEVKEYLDIYNATDCIRFLIRDFQRRIEKEKQP